MLNLDEKNKMAEKAASINMFKGLREVIFKKLKKNMTRNQQMEILKREIILKNQIKTLKIQ